ncbi:MAG: TIGR01777 family oxidoreductase [Planctomycetes bacterium]|nr:TIGR01777 family oxidoreductase [Planctomycetota bacterium]
MTGHWVIVGGSGFLGRTLIRGSTVPITVIARGTVSASRPVSVESWDGETLGPWVDRLDGAAVLVNLCGRSVDCRYDDRRRREILESRVRSTQVLRDAVSACASPPPVWLNASTATIYRHALDRSQDEPTGDLGVGFSVGVARAWEETLLAGELPRTRRVALRTSFVLGSEPGGALAILSRLARWGLGGEQGPGNQYVSWIHEHDWVRAVRFIVERDALAGPVNLTSPTPVPNHQFMAALRRAARRPFGLPTPTTLLRLGAVVLRTEPELLLKSRRVVPTRLLDAGFRFAFPEIDAALEHLLRREKRLAEWESRPALESTPE